MGCLEVFYMADLHFGHKKVILHIGMRRVRNGSYGG